MPGEDTPVRRMVVRGRPGREGKFAVSGPRNCSLTHTVKRRIQTQVFGLRRIPEALTVVELYVLAHDVLRLAGTPFIGHPVSEFLSWGDPQRCPALSFCWENS